MSKDDELFSKDELESLKSIDLRIETTYIKIPKVNSEVFEKQDQVNSYLSVEYNDSLDDMDLMEIPEILSLSDDYLSGLEEEDYEEPEDHSIHIDHDDFEEDNYDPDPD